MTAVVFQNVKKLYDGSGATAGAVRSGVDVHVENGRVTQVSPHSKKLAASDALRVVDASAYVMTPGLIDCHSHITVEGLAPGDLSALNGQASLLYVEKILYRTLVHGGVTTLRDMGGATHLMKRLVEDGVVIGPRLYIAICMLSTTGGHADAVGTDRCHGEVSKLFPPGPGRPSSLVDGPWDCRKRVREIAACGADFIKICAGRGLARGGGGRDARNLVDFTREEMEAICGEANERGLVVAAHAHSKAGIAQAIASGVRDLQHITFMEDDEFEAASKRGCTVTPTAWALKTVCTLPAYQKSIPNGPELIAAHAGAVRKAANGGVPVLAGSDPIFDGMHGRNYMELKHLVEAGLAPLAAWHGATGQAAKAVNSEDIGAVAPGKRADLLLFKDDVVEKPELFESALVEVVKDGCGYRGAVAGLEQRAFPSTFGHRLKG